MHVKLAQKVTKGQIHDGSISQNNCHDLYKICAKFYAFITKCTIDSYVIEYAAILYQQCTNCNYHIFT